MERKCTITLRDEINCNVRGLTPHHREDLFEQWAIMAHNAHFMPAVKQGKWDGRINFFKQNGNTYINLLGDIVPWLVDRDYDIEIVDTRNEHPTTHKPVDANVFTEHGITLRYYQVDAIEDALNNNGGVLNLPTGSGKTYINAALVNAYHPLRSVTIVPNTDLVTQTVKSFKKVGLDAGCFYAKKKEYDAQHIVSTWQSLKNHREILKDVGVIVLDEAHGIKGKVLTEILVEGHGSKIPFRFGLTGTIPKPKADKTTLKMALGDIVHTLTAKQLMDEGFLSKLQIHIQQLEDTPEQLKGKPKYIKGDTEAQEAAWTRERQFLTSNKHRIKNIADGIQRIINKDKSKNTLILTSSVDTGKALSKELDCKFMYGLTDTDERTSEYEHFEGVDGKKLIATFGIAKAGIDITKVHNIILIDVGKSFTTVIQSIGRGLRKDALKTFVDIYDFCSNSYYSTKHMKERISYYKEAHYPYEVHTIPIAK